MSVFVGYRKNKTVTQKQKPLSHDSQNHPLGADDFKTPERATLQGFAGGALSQYLARLPNRPLFVLTEDLKTANRLKDEIRFFAKEKRVKALPPFDVLPYHGLSPHQEISRKTISILHDCLQNPNDIFLVPKQALFRRHLPKEIFLACRKEIRAGEKWPRQNFLDDLIKLGYERAVLVEEQGTFAVRGDVLDIFPISSEHPLRLSFFDEDIESIKIFDPTTQLTEKDESSFWLLPTHEILWEKMDANWQSLLKKKTDAKHLPKDKRDALEDLVHKKIYFHGIETFLPLFYKKTSTLFDFFPKDAVLVETTEIPLEGSLEIFLQELKDRQNSSEHIESIISPEEIFITNPELQSSLNRFSFLTTRPDAKIQRKIFSKTKSNDILKTKLKSQISKIHNLSPLAEELNQKRREGFHCKIVAGSPSGAERIRDLLNRFSLPLALDPEGDEPRLIPVLIGDLHEGFLDEEKKQWWITEEEIFGERSKRIKSKPSPAAVFSSFSEISEGDYLIHTDHGIGLYQGLTHLDFDKNKNDFLTIEYLGGDKLYVPVEKLNRVQRYSAEEGHTPLLDKLGGSSWKAVHKKAKRAARKFAKELLEMQALREARKGFSFLKNSSEMSEFSSRFEFEETPDQLSAIEAVVQDMESEKTMDRLICGDVGFGKTEVAIRAAYKAILDHKQVAVLVPTTVLAFQHETTFQKRFENYPVRIELLSRFRSLKEQKVVIQDLKAGQVDIVIATHRLLSKDVRFRDLGLLIIDEEHRFGVTHKEKIKALKNLVDVITLTATPIPRTLNFALNGIRDLSLITTPPLDRLAIKTYACGFEEETLREAMLKEIRRGGQVYFVHNRVQSIEKITRQVEKLIPEAKVRFGHGQMDESELEDVMIAFMKHDFDILVCTTIIESGLDIPNANTMIINRADTFGLAQLYQLRGRVGRSHHQAYCYLVVPSSDLMTTKAKRRLATIQRFTELGSGFKVASHDLEIRGAGNILGSEQSGHIAAVGYDMYLHLLKEAILELKDEHFPEDFEPELSLNVPAKIPEGFIPDEKLRLLLYKEVSASESFEEIVSVRDHWLDRFGKLPEETENLFELLKIKTLCKKLLVSQIKNTGEKIFLNFHPEHKIDPKSLIELIQKEPMRYKISRDNRFVITQHFETPTKLFQFLKKFFEILMQSTF